MNQMEAADLAEAARVLRAGPGGSWKAKLSGLRLGPFSAEIEQRAADLNLWLETWILPAIDAAADRYSAPARIRTRPSRGEFLELLKARLGVVSVRLVDRGMTVSISRPFEASGVEALVREHGLEAMIGADVSELRIFGFRREPRGGDRA